MTEDLLVKEKIRKLQEIKDLGINPYPYKYDKKSSSKDFKKYGSLNAGEHTENSTSVAGRIVGLRKMGKIAFIHIQDENGKVQLFFGIDTLGEDKFNLVKKLDYGDFIGAEGKVFKTKTGEITIEVTNFELLCKSINPLPEKFHGLKDKELRYRQRYIDLIVNPEVKEIFKKRSLIIKSIREFLDQKGFIEVETPLLQTQYGGANARPFITHINAWDMKMFLSISPELYLKRLVVGGFEKVFTICKNFRNEGVDHSHNPEFTMIEIYQAYADYTDMMKLIEDCYEYCAIKVNGTTIVKRKIETKDGEQDIELDFKAPWPRITTVDAIKQITGLKVDEMSNNDLIDYCDANLLEYQDTNWGSLVEAIFANKVENKIIQPTHIIDRPKEGTPLCKRHRTDNRLNEQCEPLALGMELGNMYSELNDSLLQEQLLIEQAEKGRAGNEEAHPMDEDFINAIKIGMPPTGGIGWGIDRMVMVLTGSESIRDVIFFPTMKPEEVAEPQKTEDKKETQ